MLKQEAFLSKHTLGAILVAGGSGQRMGGGEPKQFRMLGGKMLLAWSLEVLLQCETITSIAVVIPRQGHDRLAPLAARDARIQLVSGGASRSESVRNGLAALGAAPPAFVLIHDAARPGLSRAVIDELVAALVDADAAAPALAMADAVKRRSATGLEAVARDDLVRIQTPQAFRWATIAEAYGDPTAVAVDDLALIEATGARIALTQGRPELMKITEGEDFAIAAKLLSAPRIGVGFDVHGFEPGDAVVLCGVRVPHTHKLEGHSDADVGWHALTDAILGAAALGDIGDHFPPSDPQWKGASSQVFLSHAARRAAERGFRIANVDVTLICETPKIAPFREAMRAATADALGIDLSCVSIKATTTEGLGFVGRKEGIAAQAAVSLTT